MTDFDSIWHTQDEIRTVVNTVLGECIWTTTTAPVTNMPDYFGLASFHENDYSFFYNNLKENVAKRIATYKIVRNKIPNPV